MDMQISSLAPDVLRVALSGRLDSPGVDQIETKFTAALVPSGAHAAVDLSQVDFVGSMAIRMFISVARSLGKHKGKLVLYAPKPLVNEVFTTVALAELIPILADADAAVLAARS